MIFSNFNNHIWNALWILGPLGGIVFYVAFNAVKGGWHYHFDPKHNKNGLLNDGGDFVQHCQRYQDLAKLAIALSSGAIAFLISTQTNLKPPLSAFVQAVVETTPIIVGFFGAAIGLLIGFMVLQTVWYEEYCHSPKHDSYRAWKYALCTSLGWSGLTAFVLGFGWMAVRLFS